MTPTSVARPFTVAIHGLPLVPDGNDPQVKEGYGPPEPDVVVVAVEQMMALSPLPAAYPATVTSVPAAAVVPTASAPTTLWRLRETPSIVVGATVRTTMSEFTDCDVSHPVGA